MPPASKADIIEHSSHTMEGNVGSSRSKLVECICHDEDEDLNMEIPCSCCGSLKYASHKCVQRWCNEKGDTSVRFAYRIFAQLRQYYIEPPLLFHYGGDPMNFRGNWEISGRDLPASLFIAKFTVLLVLRHALPIMISGAGDYSLTLFTLVLLRTIAILLPICIMVKAFTAVIQCRHRQNQDPRFSLAA